MRNSALFAVVAALLSGTTLGACRATVAAPVDPRFAAAPAAASASSTADVLCDYNVSVMNRSPSVNAVSNSRWTCTGTQRTVVANGIPDHAVVGTFPNANNPNAITAQTITEAFALTPAMGTGPTQLGGPAGLVGMMLNGVKVDPGTGGTCDNNGNYVGFGHAGMWNLEALNTSSFSFGTDENNAHVQPGGLYHYHGMPEGLVTARGGSATQMALVGWAADGFAIYGRWGHSVATDASSPLRAMRGSYQLVTTANPNRPSTTTFPLGTFQQDFVYVAGSGDLDQCNGRVDVTPEFPAGIYHYYTTDTYPYIQRCVMGTVAGGGMMPPMGDGG
ncbi:MAG: YHYH protein [Deltaproteobacteria bacterium]|nr:YHYH protein [Deltaproteobacteria bacterium]